MHMHAGMIDARIAVVGTTGTSRRALSDLRRQSFEVLSFEDEAQLFEALADGVRLDAVVAAISGQDLWPLLILGSLRSLDLQLPLVLLVEPSTPLQVTARSSTSSLALLPNDASDCEIARAVEDLIDEEWSVLADRIRSTEPRGTVRCCLNPDGGFRESQRADDETTPRSAGRRTRWRFRPA